MRANRIGFGVAVALLAGGWTDCDYFSEVKVPSHDNKDPYVYAGIHRGDKFEQLVDGGGIVYGAAPGQTLFIISAGMDAGGVKKVQMHYQWYLQCCHPGDYPDLDAACYSSEGDEDDVQTQPGAVGSKVSNGIWAGFQINVRSCPADSDIGLYSLTWNARVEDFHGNATWGQTNRIEWRFDHRD